MPFSAGPEVNNRTRFAFEPAFLADEHGAALFVPIVKATYVIRGTAALELAEEQQPVNFSGEFWGDPDTSSYRYEPEGAFMKPSTDIALVGHAHALGAAVSELTVGLRVGTVQKVITVVGDRYWEPGLGGGARMTTALPFERIPLNYEHAYGGWDRQDAERPAWEPRNPVGRGFVARWQGRDRVALPNLEDPGNRIRAVTDRPAPAAPGFVSPNWLPRAAFAGTYDQAWSSSRSPLLPMDFDRRFLNAASPGLIAPGYLAGNEPVTVLNASDRGRLDFVLPSVTAPRIQVTLRSKGAQAASARLDTVIIDTDDHRVTLIWRAYVRVTDIPRDVAAVIVESPS